MQFIGRWAVLETLNRSQTIALAQQFQNIEDNCTFAPQRFKERPLPSAKGVETGGAIEMLFNATVDFDVACVNLSKVRTRWLITPSPFEFHDASPPGQMIRQLTLSG